MKSEITDTFHDHSIQVFIRRDERNRDCDILYILKC